MPERISLYNEGETQSAPEYANTATAQSSSHTKTAQQMTTEYVPGVAATTGRKMSREPAICSTDDDAILPQKRGDKKKLDKSSWEYVIKSGIAGGLAGCAVCLSICPLLLFKRYRTLC